MSRHWRCTGLPDGTCLRILAGAPTPEELVALVVALDRAAPEHAEPAQARPRWLAGARQEGVGGRPAATPADLSAGATAATGAAAAARRPPPPPR